MALILTKRPSSLCFGSHLQVLRLCRSPEHSEPKKRERGRLFSMFCPKIVLGGVPSLKRVPRFSLGVSRSGLGTATNKAHSAVYSHLTGTPYECKKTGMDAQARTCSQLSAGRGSSFHQAAPKTMDAAVPQAHQECCERCSGKAVYVGTAVTLLRFLDIHWKCSSFREMSSAKLFVSYEPHVAVSRVLRAAKWIRMRLHSRMAGVMRMALAS